MWPHLLRLYFEMQTVGVRFILAVAKASPNSHKRTRIAANLGIE